MKYLMMLVVMGVAGYFAFQQFKPKPPPPPPPPPPAILLEPTPVISEEEQAKVLKAANDPDPEVRWQSMLLLEKMRSPRALEVMFEKLHKDFDTELRVKILELLSKKAQPEVTQNVVWVLKDPNPEIRLAALRALEKIGDYATASAITELLKDSDEQVKVQAIRTLNTLQDKKTAEIEAERRRQEELRRQQEEQARKNR